MQTAAYSRAQIPEEKDRPMRWRTCLTLTLVMLSSATATARSQFATLVPGARPREEVQSDELRQRFIRFVSDSVLSQEQRRAFSVVGLPMSNIREIKSRFCSSLRSEERQLCDRVIPEPTTVSPRSLRGEISRKVLSLDFPLAHDRGELAEYMRAINDSAGASLFSQFSSSVSEDEAFVSTNVISGLAGRVIISINYAAVVVKSDSADTTARKTVENNTSTIMRMVNNGGSLSARFLMPIHAISHATFSSASSLYVTAGMTGPLTTSEVAGLGLSAVGEYMSRISLRDPTQFSNALGDLVLGARVGFGYSGEGLIEQKGKTMVFGQLATGLIQNNKLSLSVLLSMVPKKYKEYMPSVQVNLSAIR